MRLCLGQSVSAVSGQSTSSPHHSNFVGPSEIEATSSTLPAALETSRVPAVLVAAAWKRQAATGARHIAFTPAPSNGALRGQTQGERHSEEATVLEVVLDDDVCDSVEHKLDVVGVGGTSEVRVDLLGVAALVE